MLILRDPYLKVLELVYWPVAEVEPDTLKVFFIMISVILDNIASE